MKRGLNICSKLLRSRCQESSLFIIDNHPWWSSSSKVFIHVFFFVKNFRSPKAIRRNIKLLWLVAQKHEVGHNSTNSWRDWFYWWKCVNNAFYTLENLQHLPLCDHLQVRHSHLLKGTFQVTIRWMKFYPN